MTRIAGAQICTTGFSMRRQAKQVIEHMHRLLEARKVHRVTRRVFIKQWDKLRTQLFLTPDYQDLRSRIYQRCEGICEVCGKVPFAHVHHVIPVAFEPSRALEDKNCKGVCINCHNLEHRRNATKARDR